MKVRHMAVAAGLGMALAVSPVLGGVAAFAEPVANEASLSTRLRSRRVRTSGAPMRARVPSAWAALSKRRAFRTRWARRFWAGPMQVAK